MTAEEKELANRALELSSRAAARNIYTNTQFLTEGQKETLSRLPLPLRPRFFGGVEDAQRFVAVFGEEEEIGYPWESVLSIVRIRPKDAKFAEELSHRDFLGALLNLGMKRELLGDLVVHEKTCYLICLESIAPFVVSQLERVRNTAVKAELCDEIPPDAAQRTREEEVVCASNRLDAVVSAVWNLSRSEGKELVAKEKVMIRGTICTDPGKALASGDRVSVRGYGKFYYDGEKNQTRSGKSRILVRLFV